LKLQELAAMDSKRWLIGCRDAFRAGVLGVVIAALIVWFFPGRMTGDDGIFADPGRKANLLGLLVLGPFGFVVGSIIGAVIAALGFRSAATRKSVATSLGPRSTEFTRSLMNEAEPLWSGRPDPPPTPARVKGLWPRKSVLAAFSLIPIGFLLWFVGLGIGLGGGEQWIVGIATY
jgi:hypothetical protein